MRIVLMRELEFRRVDVLSRVFDRKSREHQIQRLLRRCRETGACAMKRAADWQGSSFCIPQSQQKQTGQNGRTEKTDKHPDQLTAVPSLCHARWKQNIQPKHNEQRKKADNQGK